MNYLNVSNLVIRLKFIINTEQIIAESHPLNRELDTNIYEYRSKNGVVILYVSIFFNDNDEDHYIEIPLNLYDTDKWHVFILNKYTSNEYK